MGKIVVCSMVSIDGYAEGRDGDVMAMPMDEAFALHNEDRVRSASSFLFGATTYRGFLALLARPARQPGGLAPEPLHRGAVRRGHPHHGRLRHADHG